MTDPENNFSRLNRKKGRRRADKVLNVLIVAVIVAIIITAIIIFNGGNDEVNNKNEEKPSTTEEIEGNSSKDKGEEKDEENDANLDNENIEDPADDPEAIVDKEDESGVVTYLYPDDKIIEQSIVDPNWKPVGTTQTGEHVSLYDENSVDWKEKQEAIADATGLSIENTITWRIKNGGSPQKSIGIVSSKDEAEKYRVYLEWVENEGWKTVKMDVLKTLDFDYKSSN